MSGTMEFGQLRLHRVWAVLRQCRFRDWDWWLEQDHGSVQMRFRVMFQASDNFNPEGPKVPQFGRWWCIHENASEEDIVRTAWLAIQQAMEHEMREQFTYQGRRVFDPHKKLLEPEEAVKKTILDLGLHALSTRGEVLIPD